MAIGDTAQPTNGVPSLTTNEIISLYQKWLGRAPDGNELATDSANALKYSAAGIENQIALRAGNAPNTGIRGDEGQAPLTVPADVTGHAVTLGPALLASPGVTPGPTGTLTPTDTSSPVGTLAGVTPATLSVGGIDLGTLLVGAVALGAAWFLWTHRK